MAVHRIVVVGASLAGLRAVEAARRQGFDGELVLIGAEPHRPYDRPPLSKAVLQGRLSPEKVFFRRRDGYEALALDLRLGVSAVHLDAAARRLTLGDGSRVDYDALVIATGATPRSLPGAEPLEGVFTLRTLDDSLALAAALAGRPRVVLVGAGFIGLEVAASCRELGCEVTVVDPIEVPLAPILGEVAARRVLELHERAGVVVRGGVGVRALEGPGRVERVRLADGSALETEVVVVGIGVRPASQWLADVGEGSGLHTPRGVLCDARGATSVPDVYAAGDVACWLQPATGEPQRVEHWTSAVEQANAVVSRILQGPEASEPLSSVPYFWSDQHGVKIQFAGRAAGHDQLLWLEDDRDARRLVALYGSGGKLVGALCFGRPAALMRYRTLIGQGASLAEAAQVS